MEALPVDRIGRMLGSPTRPASSESWLISKSSDFWLACAGGGVLLVLMGLVVQWHGDRELDVADLLLSELHLGATYDAILRSRLWRRMPIDVLAIPLALVAATYGLMLGGHSILLTTLILHLAAWHRGRQNFGIARYYQARTGGPLSASHQWLFRAAIYMPMIAGVVYFTGTSPFYEGDQYVGLELDPGVLRMLGIAAAISVATYLLFALRHRAQIHPGERWLVMANALAFGSAYVLGAWSVSFILVMAVHHEIQYLYFTYSMARRSAGAQLAEPRGELRLLASFAVWPAIGLTTWGLCQLSDSIWLSAFLLSGLLCHFWLDGRIWTRRARALAS